MSHACHRFWKCYKTLTFCSLLTRCTIPCACHAKRHLNVQKCSEPLSFLHFWLRNVLRATTACTFSTSQLPKVVRSWCVLYIFTSKRASRHNGVHFFNISTSKSAPNPSVFTLLTSKCASRHNGVQFFISHLASWLCTRRFSEPTFRPSGATNHWKSTVFRDFPTFSRTWIFFLLTLSLSSPLLFSASAHLCFSSVHIDILSEVWLLNFLRKKLGFGLPGKKGRHPNMTLGACGFQTKPGFQPNSVAGSSPKPLPISWNNEQ